MTGHHHRLPKRDREWRCDSHRAGQPRRNGNAWHQVRPRHHQYVAQSKLAPHKLLQHVDVPESVVCFQTGRATVEAHLPTAPSPAARPPHHARTHSTNARTVAERGRCAA